VQTALMNVRFEGLDPLSQSVRHCSLKFGGLVWVMVWVIVQVGKIEQLFSSTRGRVGRTPSPPDILDLHCFLLSLNFSLQIGQQTRLALVIAVFFRSASR
jgi:hypothetical protein